MIHKEFRALWLLACLVFWLCEASGSPPVISGIADRTIGANSATPLLAFTIGDAETPALSLTLSGSSTNTVLVPNNRIVFSGSASNRSVRITPATNQIGTSRITITVTDSAAETASTNFLLTVTNGAPTITDIANRMINPGITSAPISFVVFDRETSPSNLVVHSFSTDTNLVASGQMFFGGSGSNRNVRFRPAMQLGLTTISLTVTDVFGASATDSFQLMITNARPGISFLGSFTGIVNTASAQMPFSVTDLESAASSLIVTAHSSNTVLVADANISLGGTGSNRWVSVMPGTNQVGNALIGVVVRDEFDARATNFLSVSFSQFGEITNSLPGFAYPNLAPGDYDGDGWLDYVAAGYPGTNLIYRNQGNGVFTNIGVNLLGVYSGSLTWGDYDRDGDLDLVTSGRTEAGTNTTRLYRNDNGSFNVMPTSLPALFYSAVAWGDYDNDGDPDLLIAGESNNLAVTRIFRRDASGLVDSGIELPAVSSAAAAWGDYDSDGDLDLFLSGSNAGGNAQARVYRNAGNGIFINLGAAITGLVGGSAAWGDYDGDGDLDVLLHGGSSQGGGYTRLIRNEGNDQFSEPAVGLDYSARMGAGWGDYDNDGDLDVALGYRYEHFGTHFYRNDGGTYVNSSNYILGLGQGTLGWGDFDNDSRLDLLQIGVRDYPTYSRLTRLFRNHGALTNPPPLQPTGLVVKVEGRTARLSWSPASDPNQSSSLTYNLRVGTAAGAGNILSPQSLSGGRRLLPEPGNVWLNSKWRLQNLAAGTYYASVQAVDAGFAGSPFSTEISFTVANSPGPPSASTEAPAGITFSDAILSGTVCANGLPSTAWFEFGTTTNFGAKSPTLAIGSSANYVAFSQTVTGLVAATAYHVRLVAANSAGTNRGETRVFLTPNFTSFSELKVPLLESPYGLGLWGDYDSDNDLDLYISGAGLFRNDAGVFADSLNALPAGAEGWGDFNRDNRIDLFAHTNVFQNNGAGGFVMQPLQLNLPPSEFYINRLGWGDYDHDGDPDVLVGRYYSGYGQSTLCRNNGTTSFTPVSSGLPSGPLNAVAWLDYDNDGWLDLALSFSTYYDGPVYLYHNEGNGTFATNSIELTNSVGQSVDWTDFDNDGDLDLAISGNTKVYINQGTNGFTPLAATNLPYSSQVCWGDYDNDGDPDLLLLWNLYAAAWVYRNDAGSFIEDSKLVSATFLTHASWADYDKDGDVDIVVSGEGHNYQKFTRLYRNNSPVSNAPPTAPTSLLSAFAGKAVRLSWNPPVDANQTNGWSYNVRVGSTPGGSEILSPLANLTSGYRRVARFGNAGVGPGWVLTNLPVGTYYWSVQAVDHGFAGSPFAAERSFVVPPWPPDILSVWSTNPTLTSVTLAGQVNPNNRATTVWFQYGLTTNYTHVSVSRPLPAANSPIATNMLVSGLTPLATYHWRMVASNQLGVTYSPDQIFETVQFTALATTFNMPESWQCLWADLDTDGFLDALIFGLRNGTYGGYFHRNDGNGVFTQPGATLPFSYEDAWAGNLDRDDDLDLVLPDGYQPVYFNNGAVQFVNSANPLGFNAQVVLPGDVDNDGDLDLFVAGYDINSRSMSALYTNDGSGIFRDSQFPFIPSRTGTGAWADTDSDGDLDLAFCGEAGINPTNFSRLYRNDGALGFTTLSGWFEPIGSAAMCWTDYDNDGDPDMFLTGYGTNGHVARLYRTDGPNTFTEIEAGMSGLSSPSAQWGDYDNDGRADLLLTGYTNFAYTATLLYRNLGNDQFVLRATGIPGVFSGDAEWGDCDRDGDLDILLAGRYVPACLYRNNALTPNSPPQPPANLASTVINGNSARLSWRPGVDANQSGGHSFNLRVGTSPGDNSVVDAQAVWPGGARRITGPGNVHLATNWLLKALSPGTYYWSVQAVDHSFAGSAFAAEKTFTVLPFTQPPALIMAAATNVEFFTAELRGAINPNGVTSTAWFEYGLTTNYGGTTPRLVVGNGPDWLNFTQWASNLTAETTYHWRFVGSNVNGLTHGFDQTFTTPPYVLFTEKAQMLSFQNGSAAWGDYDNDGDLDLLITGLAYEAGTGSTTRCRVYRNDAGGFTDVPLGLVGSWQGDAKWGDYDNDGDLDIVMAGNSDQAGNTARLYRNDGPTLFTYVPVTLPAVYQGTLEWGDFDRDGDLDLVVASSASSIVYRNAGHDTFVQQAALQSLSSAALGVADFDNDGDLDILLTGYASGPGARLYVNDGRSNFSLLNTTLPAVSDGGVAWGDYDNDGDLDVALTGSRWSSPSAYLAGVYRNDGNGVFTDLQLGLPGVQSSSCAWGDYENDGDLDLLLTGRMIGAGGICRVYRNDGGTFTDVGAGLQPVESGGAVWGDYDNDGDLDFVQVGGGYTRIYRNNATNANALPAAPANLEAAPVGDSVLLSWFVASDANQPGGLTYNVRIGTAPGAADVLGPMADAVTGFRRVPQPGNAGVLNWLWVTNLASGTYYWSVQAVDHALAGSPFAAERTFAIQPRQPDALTTAATNIAITSATLTGYSIPNGAATAAWFQYGIGGYTSTTPAQNLGGGFVQVAVTFTITNLFPGSLYQYRLVASNSFGTTLGAPQTFVPPMFTEIAAPFVPVKSGSVMWGDYDADGDLDLLLTGDSTNVGNSTVSRLYRNNGNSSFTDMNSPFAPAIFPGNWGDADNDGDLDLLLGTRLYRSDIGVFSQVPNGLPPIAYPATAWGDSNNDGKLDILLAGFVGGSGTTSRVSQIYRNLGGGAFTNSGATMQGVENPSVAWGDYDNDGDLDVLRTGFNTGGVRDSRVYRNNGNGTFSSLTAFMLAGVTFGSGVWGDCDNDGDLDILLTGETSTNRVTKVYVNQGNHVFTDWATGLPGITFGTALWADYDNDGDLDILLSGQSASGLLTKMYRQDGLRSFVDSQITFPGLMDSAAAWGDYDNDGDLDLMLTGYGEGSTRVTRLYRNNCRIPNSPPTSPTGLLTTVNGSSVQFDWTASTDANQPGGLGYNLRVGTTSGGANAVAAMASPTTGRRQIASMGNAQLRTSWTITNLPPGPYYWSVQALDHSFAGSAFASEASFFITNHPPSAHSQTVVLGEDTTQPLSLSATDADAQTLTYVVLSPSTNGVLTGTPPNLVYRPATNFFGADTFTFRALDGITNSEPGAVSLIITQTWDVAGSRLVLQRQSNGPPMLALISEPYERYRIQVSSDLIYWSNLTNVSSSDGLVKLMLADAASFPRRFYRASLLLAPAAVESARSSPLDGFTLDFTGELARFYAIQASADLVNWTSLTNLLMTHSPATFTDPAATNFVHRFYRVMPIGP